MASNAKFNYGFSPDNITILIFPNPCPENFKELDEQQLKLIKEEFLRLGFIFWQNGVCEYRINSHTDAEEVKALLETSPMFSYDSDLDDRLNKDIKAMGEFLSEIFS